MVQLVRLSSFMCAPLCCLFQTEVLCEQYFGVSKSLGPHSYMCPDCNIEWTQRQSHTLRSNDFCYGLHDKNVCFIHLCP